MCCAAGPILAAGPAAIPADGADRRQAGLRTIREASISGCRQTPSGTVFASFPIDLFADPATAPLFADQVQGRIVLIGGDLPDRDQFEIPATPLAMARP